jgi:hypothetical protein
MNSGRVGSSCSICTTRCVTLATNPVIRHECGKNLFVITTNGTYPWSFVTYISACRCAWNASTYKRKIHNEKIEIITFVVMFRS